MIITTSMPWNFFFAGEDGKLSTAMRFGDALQPGGQTVVMRGHARLHQGENHFWLSCRLEATASLDHKVDATCVDIDTTAGHIKPVDRTGDLRKRIGIALRKHYDDGVHTYRIPALATTPQNTLLCVYDMRRRTSRDLQEDIDIGLLRSVDGGQTWEPQRIIMDQGTYGGKPQELNGVSDPGIIVDPATGEIFCFAVWMVGKEGKHQWTADGSEPGFEIGKSAQLLMVRSRDDGQTWSKPQNMTRAWKEKEWVLYTPSPQQGIALADGTLVMPTQGRNAQGREFSNLLTSDDHGAHWTVSQPASVGNSECQAVQLGDGSIMLNMRTEHGVKFRTVATTRDLGQTWVPDVTIARPSSNRDVTAASVGLIFDRAVTTATSYCSPTRIPKPGGIITRSRSVLTMELPGPRKIASCWMSSAALATQALAALMIPMSGLFTKEARLTWYSSGYRSTSYCSRETRHPRARWYFVVCGWSLQPTCSLNWAIKSSAITFKSNCGVHPQSRRAAWSSNSIGQLSIRSAIFGSVSKRMSAVGIRAVMAVAISSAVGESACTL